MASGEQHKALAARCQPWLNRRTTGRGHRGGYEVPLANGYIADWVALCGFQNQFRQQYVEDRELERRGAVLICPEFACVFEVKVSRGDFFSTFGHGQRFAEAKRDQALGSLHWVVTPRGLIDPQRVPTFWGLLEMSGGGLREVRRPKFVPMPCEALYEIGYSLLWYGKNYAG